MDLSVASVGVDLAWGQARLTGLCAAVGGHVVDSTTVQTDDEIVGWIRRWLGESTIVAVDAPVVVPNMSGQREAERLVGVLFGKAGGSAHSTNRGRPGFADGGRAARLARGLGLSVDPAAPLPVMIEVYPHVALIALFGLDRVLGYKRKRLRSVEERKAAFRAFTEHLLSLRFRDPSLDVSRSARWDSLCHDLDSASSHAALSRLEDELDAHICAYVGLHRIRWGNARSAVLGNVNDGYIVTPLDDERLARLPALQGTRDVVGFDPRVDSRQPTQPPVPAIPPVGRDLSLFSRLFTYARSTTVDQLENFTTEALAATIRSDPRPLFAALARHGVIEGLPSGALLVTTQEVVAGVGIVDLVVRTYVGSTPTLEIWIEAKVFAGESGDQLSRYAAAAGRRATARLVVLGRRPIGENASVPWLPWQSLRDAADRDAAGLWQELTQFLQEQGVTDQSTDPITAREATSLLDSHALFQKATKLLTELNKRGPTQWPQWGWRSSDQIPQFVLGQFQRHRRYALTTGGDVWLWLVLGYTDEQSTGEVHATVWVESDPKKVPRRQAILAQADSGGLDPSWIRRIDGWQALSKTQRAAVLEGFDRTLMWFTDRLDELAAAGIAGAPSQQSDSAAGGGPDEAAAGSAS